MRKKLFLILILCVIPLSIYAATTALRKTAGASVDNTVPRFDGTSGDLLQTSSVTIDDSGNMGVTTLTVTTANITNSSFTNAPTLSDGVKWTFNPNGTTAGINIGEHTSDPSVTGQGDMWYNSTEDKFKVDLDGLVEVIVLNDLAAALTNKTIDNALNTLKIASEVHSVSDTLTASECYGKIHYVTAASTITLPAIADGMSVTIITVGNVAVSLDVNAADKMILDGVTLDDGDKTTNTSTTNDTAVATYYSADGWYVMTNGWTDAG
jgi:hypothetical protein